MYEAFKSQLGIITINWTVLEGNGKFAVLWLYDPREYEAWHGDTGAEWIEFTWSKTI